MLMKFIYYYENMIRIVSLLNMTIDENSGTTIFNLSVIGKNNIMAIALFLFLHLCYVTRMTKDQNLNDYALKCIVSIYVFVFFGR